MFKKLQDKWKVKGLDFLLIFLTFAIGGSLCGITGKKILELLGIEKGFAWVVTYIVVMTLIWPLCVLLVSIPFGQFRFFKTYIGKILARIGGTRMAADQPTALNPTIKIAIFASGAGTNAAKIIEHFKKNDRVTVAFVVTNKPGAGVVQIAHNVGLPVLIIEKERFNNGDAYLDEFTRLGIQWIVLAGFLWKVPIVLIKAFPRRIINIHPALLPKYGGKGMYGSRVHEAVIAAGEKDSGISIHYVDEIYDHGEVILQQKCLVTKEDTAETLAAKIHALEHKHFPTVIEQEVLKGTTVAV